MKKLFLFCCCSGILLSSAVTAQDCTSDDFLKACPATCASACENVKLYRDSPELCEAAFSSNSEDPVQCNSGGPLPTVSVAQCVDQSAKKIPEASPLIKSNSKRLEFYNAFYSNTPECAGGSEFLEEMYTCLSTEASSIISEFSEVDTLEASPDQFEELQRVFCEIGEERLLAIDQSAHNMQVREVELGGQIARVSQCRASYGKWIKGWADSFCTESDFPACTVTANLFKERIESQLTDATAQNDRINELADELKSDLSLIFQLGLLSGLFKCES